MAFVENKYMIDGVLYNIMETQDTHEKIQNDSEFASSYIREYSGDLVDFQAVALSEESMFTWTTTSANLLLQEYKERKDKFKNPAFKKKDLWTEIQSEFERHGYFVSTEALDKKFRNMKKTFMQIRDKKQRTGGTVAWQYYDTFCEILPYEKASSLGSTSKIESRLNNHKPILISNVVSSMVTDDEENMNVIPQMANLSTMNSISINHRADTEDSNNPVASGSTTPDASFWAEILLTEKQKLQEAKKLRIALENMVSVQKERNILLAKLIPNLGKDSR